ERGQSHARAGPTGLQTPPANGAAADTYAVGDAGPQLRHDVQSPGGGHPGPPKWIMGRNHSAQQWQAKMAQRGWTPNQIAEAMQNGQRYAATNNVNAGNSATRYVHPATGRSVVVDDVTAEVIH